MTVEQEKDQEELRKKLANLRREYKLQALDEGSMAENPVTQFGLWYDHALKAGVVDPNAFSLATATADARPSARIVLLKDYGTDGFTFYTNYESDKGRHLAENPHAELLFYWPALERQVRIAGRVEKVSTETADDYFATRPRGAQLGAHASDQSRPVENRQALERRMSKAFERFRGQDVPRPAYWGGYRLVPDRFEFWQGRENRLHDRVIYELAGEGRWSRQRIAP